MMHDESTQSRLDIAGERMSRQLATRFGRRSFLGYLGRGTVGLALVGFGTRAAVAPPEAAAHGRCGRLSVTCARLTGNNTCPPGTCYCGYWFQCHRPCGRGNVARMMDCCSMGDTCEGRSRCDDVVTCWHHKVYSQGCGSLNPPYSRRKSIRCRVIECTSASNAGRAYDNCGY